MNDYFCKSCDWSETTSDKILVCPDCGTDVYIPQDSYTSFIKSLLSAGFSDEQANAIVSVIDQRIQEKDLT